LEEVAQEEFLDTAQLELVELEQELALITERNIEMREDLGVVSADRKRLGRETTVLREQLNTLEYAVEKEAAGLDRVQVRSFKLTKAEVKAIYTHFAERDGTGNCLRLTNLLRVWKDLWRAQGRLDDFPLKAKELVVQACGEKVLDGNRYIEWTDFWEVYSLRWQDVLQEGLSV